MRNWITFGLLLFQLTPAIAEANPRTFLSPVKRLYSRKMFNQVRPISTIGLYFALGSPTDLIEITKIKNRADLERLSGMPIQHIEFEKENFRSGLTDQDFLILSKNKELRSMNLDGLLGKDGIQGLIQLMRHHESKVDVLSIDDAQISIEDYAELISQSKSLKAISFLRNGKIVRLNSHELSVIQRAIEAKGYLEGNLQKSEVLLKDRYYRDLIARSENKQSENIQNDQDNESDRVAIGVLITNMLLFGHPLGAVGVLLWGN